MHVRIAVRLIVVVGGVALTFGCGNSTPDETPAPIASAEQPAGATPPDAPAPLAFSSSDKPLNETLSSLFQALSRPSTKSTAEADAQTVAQRIKDMRNKPAASVAAITTALSDVNLPLADAAGLLLMLSHVPGDEATLLFETVAATSFAPATEEHDLTFQTASARRELAISLLGARAKAGDAGARAALLRLVEQPDDSIRSPAIRAALDASPERFRTRREILAKLGPAEKHLAYKLY